MAGILGIILFAPPPPGAGPLELALGRLREALAERMRRLLLGAGATGARVVGPSAPGEPVGARIRAIAAAERPDGMIITGAGAAPLASMRDLETFVSTAGASSRQALANNRYSTDLLAVACAASLRDLPDLRSDNAIARWLEEVAGYEVRDVRRSVRLQLDVDTPLDTVLIAAHRSCPAEIRTAARDLSEAEVVRGSLAGVASVMRDPGAELVVAGRTSGQTIRWLERSTACRVRAIVEERGLRAGAPVAPRRRDAREQRKPGSVLGMLLERDGPEALGARLAELGDAALIDSRVLLAHRRGADDRAWPAAEERFASDLLLPDRVADPWLRTLTASAAAATIPVVMGGHTLVGPGVRLVARF